MELYTEYMVARKKTPIDVIISILTVICAAFISLIALQFIFRPVYGTFVLLAIAALWYGVYFLIGSRSLEFEYCITEGEMDVDVIKGKSRRKHLASIDIRNVEIIAPTTVDYASEYDRRGIQRKIDASKGDNNVTDFFVIFYEKEQLTRLVFTPNESMLEMMKKLNPSHTFLE